MEITTEIPKDLLEQALSAACNVRNGEHAIIDRKKRIIEYAVECGDALKQIRELLKPKKEWQAWIAANSVYALTPDTADRYIKLSDFFRESLPSELETALMRHASMPNHKWKFAQGFEGLTHAYKKLGILKQPVQEEDSILNIGDAASQVEIDIADPQPNPNEEFEKVAKAVKRLMNFLQVMDVDSSKKVLRIVSPIVEWHSDAIRIIESRELKLADGFEKAA
jgi:hypothetical protein